jgi:hypothetical protein
MSAEAEVLHNVRSGLDLHSLPEFCGYLPSKRQSPLKVTEASIPTNRKNLRSDPCGFKGRFRESRLTAVFLSAIQMCMQRDLTGRLLAKRQTRDHRSNFSSRQGSKISMPDDQIVLRHSTKPTVEAAQDLVLTSLLHLNLMLSLLQSSEGQRETATLYAIVKDFSLSLPFAPLFYSSFFHPSPQIKPPPKAFFRLERRRKPLST